MSTPLHISREEGERLQVLLDFGGEIWIEVLEAKRGRARLRIIAPPTIIVRREEVAHPRVEENGNV